MTLLAYKFFLVYLGVVFKIIYVSLVIWGSWISELVYFINSGIGLLAFISNIASTPFFSETSM